MTDTTLIKARALRMGLFFGNPEARSFMKSMLGYALDLYKDVFYGQFNVKPLFTLVKDALHFGLALK